jgi:hypothetical protein
MHILNALLAAMALVFSLGTQAPGAGTSLHSAPTPTTSFVSLLRGQDKSAASTGYATATHPCPYCTPFAPCRC